MFKELICVFFGTDWLCRSFRWNIILFTNIPSVIRPSDMAVATSQWAGERSSLFRTREFVGSLKNTQKLMWVRPLASNSLNYRCFFLFCIFVSSTWERKRKLSVYRGKFEARRWTINLRFEFVSLTTFCVFSASFFQCPNVRFYRAAMSRSA